MPPDFPEVFVFLGCMGAELHFRTNGKALQRWLNEYGADRLVQLRRGYLRKVAASQGRVKVSGGPLRTRGCEGYGEMRAGDPALEWMPVRRLRRPFDGDVWVAFDGRTKPALDED